MSKEALLIVTKMNQEELKTQIALQCAPVLAGLKISNLLIVNSQNKNQVIETFKQTSISYRILHESEEKTTFLLYHKEKLEAYLSEPQVKTVMQSMGYDDLELNGILLELSIRYTRYKRQRTSFPHELGLMLGYPAEDVVGFMKHNGKNPMHTGYWKVYSNLADTLKVFEQFNQAKETMIRLVGAGLSVSQILERYGYNRQSIAV